MKHLLNVKRLLLALGLAAFCVAPFAVFDPVNDDTDLFRNNPNIPSERPNVLIILDNTANWTPNFAAERSALVTLVNGDGVVGSSNETGLDSSFNVGMMIFGQDGNACEDSTLTGTPVPSGGYVRFGIRQMTTANKTILAGIVNSFSDDNCAQNGDQGNSATGAQALHEAYLYYGGKPARHGISQIKRDYAGSDSRKPYSHPTRLPTNTTNTPYPLASQDATSYTSPITADCMKNYIIYISNGKVDSSDNNPSTTLFSHASTGLVPNATAFSLPTAGVYANSWMDEYASFLATTGVDFTNASNVTAKQTIFTYVVDVQGNNPDAEYGVLLQAVADRGKGTKYTVAGANVAQELVAALKSIFSEINAVNSVFASSTLPVSVNVRGTNLNQLYIGVFRPDSGDNPRWLGNLKAYRLQLSSGLVRSVDANTQPAIDDATGFIRATGTSFWTQSDNPTSTYWSHLPAASQGVGGASDSPDGNLVEKGGAAQRLRGLYYTNGVNGTPSRPVYTCTNGTLYLGHECVAGALLSETPFITDNEDIGADDLNITSRTITSLSAAASKSITALTDRRTVSLDNSDPSGTNELQSITLTTPSPTLAGVTSMSNNREVTITAMSNGASQKTVTLSKQGTGGSAVSKGVVSAGHGLQEQQLVIVGNGGSSSGAAFVTSGANITYVSSTDFTYVLGGGNSSTITNGTLTTSLTETTVTAAGHGFATNDQVTIANTSGSTLTSTFAKTASVTRIDDNTFKYSTSVSVAPNMSGGAKASIRGRDVVVNATGVGSILAVGRKVTIAGATPTSYNGTWDITAISTNSFTFQASASNIPTGDATTLGTISYGSATAIATVRTPPHAYVDGQVVTISGASPDGYNLTTTISVTSPADNIAGTFRYTVVPGLVDATANPTIKASTSNLQVVTVTLANHGFLQGDRISILGVDSPHFQTDVPITEIVDPNTFKYDSGTTDSIGVSDPGNTPPSVQLTTNPLVYATIPAHGYTGTFPVTISGATPAGYNGVVSATVLDANTITYVLPSPVTNAATVTGSAGTDTLTATAVSASHGFGDQEQVTIAGATPIAFNGTKTITKISNDVFTYTLGTEQGVATGSPTITAAGNSERVNIINWIRGENNKGDDGITASTRPRPSIHGDVLHSRPAVVNYNRLAPCLATDQDCLDNVDNDVYIFYGGNDGLFRAIKGGLGSASTDPAVGTEIWAFAAPEQFANLRRLRTNSPPISSGFKKPYFFDGPIGVYTRDTNGDGKLFVADNVTPDPTSTTQDKVWIYLTMRRGGQFMYAFDITQPLKPRLLWRKGCPSMETDTSLHDANGCDLGFGELGQTWSEPKVISINCVSTSYNCGTTDPVLMFGGGYDEQVEDPQPSTVNCATASEIRTGGTMGDCSTGTSIPRSMGRGIFVVNARTGALIFRASGQATPASTPTGSTFKVVTDMDYAIPSDIAVVVGDPVAKPFRAYVGDTGGQLWRFDFGDVNPSNWALTKVASIADQSTVTTYADAFSGTNVTALRGLRKFQFAPDVVASTGFDMIVIGSGDREHPFDTTVLNRVYGFKDTAQTTTPPTLTTILHSTNITYNGSNAVKALLDVTTQCIEIPGNCTTNTANHGGPEQAAGVSGVGSTPTASSNASGALSATGNKGWFIELGQGEKQVGSTLASGSGVVQFGTNQPSTTAGGGTSCSPNLGTARQYQINYLDGTAYNGVTLGTEFSGGGYLPSPVLVYVSLGGESGLGESTGSGVAVGGGITSGSSGLTVGAGASTGGSAGGASAVVCYGAVCSLAPGSVLFSRVRKFWYKEID